mmetsp:Transcript_2605/g.6336  ORF Transcript_2605/g.6336 Transcript_2605/m.6336 type:complete len:122 (-) Transcript_2605:82-447(-)
MVVCVNWGDVSHHEDALSSGAGAAREGYDVILISDCIVGGFDTDRLWQSCHALLSKRPSAQLIMAYEFREEWETVGMFIHSASEAGLDCTHAPIPEDDDDDDSEMFLYTFRWRDAATVPPT